MQHASCAPCLCILVRPELLAATARVHKYDDMIFPMPRIAEPYWISMQLSNLNITAVINGKLSKQCDLIKGFIKHILFPLHPNVSFLIQIVLRLYSTIYIIRTRGELLFRLRRSYFTLLLLQFVLCFIVSFCTASIPWLDSLLLSCC